MTLPPPLIEARTVPYSLRRRLTVGMVAGFLAILVVLSIGLWTYARNAANQTYDLLLAGSAIAILERISPTPDGLIVDIPSSALEIVGLAKEDRVFYRIFRLGGSTLTGDPDLPLPPGGVRAGDQPRFFDAPFSREGSRFVLQGKLIIEPTGPDWIMLQLGHTRLARDAMQMDLFSKGLAGLVAIAVLGLVFMRLGINRAMAPLAGIEADIRGREPSDMTPLDAKPPREVEGLIGAINDFMGRLVTSKEHAQSFIADVAHQMRTSLAALQGQLQLAAEQDEPERMRQRLERASEQATRTIRLTNQLLSHAMVTHRGIDEPVEKIDLMPLIRASVEEFLRHPETEGIDIAVLHDDLPAGSALLVADPVALREALRNLLDNAARHGPKDIRIDIGLSRTRIDEREALCISLDDSGPGIPAAEREKVLERFYSLNRAGGGSGIGLSIVNAVARSHGGRLALCDSRLGGLRVELDLPVDGPA
ncbi:sensor histidine kinase N-terminal domain-containing protein [Stappia indica]|uniref:sensor histidine kinase N-terminal domain-containing protein n=1 Tax=Stappia indica TaxID=538381 RepID=UPI0009F40005|nr:sensor histidine kinase [Stappia indica]